MWLAAVCEPYSMLPSAVQSWNDPSIQEKSHLQCGAIKEWNANFHIFFFSKQSDMLVCEHTHNTCICRYAPHHYVSIYLYNHYKYNQPESQLTFLQKDYFLFFS